MKAKIIDRNLEDYGEVIDVVWNPYMNKYTDGKKLLKKESLSFDNIEDAKNDESARSEKIEERAFELFRTVYALYYEDLQDDRLTKSFNRCFELAEKFCEVAANRNKEELSSAKIPYDCTLDKPAEYYESLLDSQPIEEDKIPEEVPNIDEETTSEVPQKELGIDDFLKEIDF